MKDKEFLTHLLLYWPHKAMPLINREHMAKLRAMIDATPEHQDTPIAGEASVEYLIAKFKKTYSGEGSGMDLLNIIEALNKQKADK